ncbi:MAG: septal ring lytic transglycosylase RlpA family protein [Deltaproteobacteria bacterium]|nr:septal ring lytic transglycosylase RlpA family protein [Deltaproteobacteria bacterium]
MVIIDGLHAMGGAATKAILLNEKEPSRSPSWFFALNGSRAGLCVLLMVGLTLPLLLNGCASTVSRRPSPPPIVAPVPAHPQTGQLGVASWYGPGFQGNLTASGEVYNQHALTAAHPTLPLGTPVEVTNVANGKSVRVRITDRGPFVRGRAIDLSRGAAQKLGIVNAGLSRVRIKPLTGSRLGDRRSAPSRPRLIRRSRQVTPAPPPVPAPPLKGVLVLERKEVEGSLY